MRFAISRKAVLGCTAVAIVLALALVAGVVWLVGKPLLRGDGHYSNSSVILPIWSWR